MGLQEGLIERRINEYFEAVDRLEIDPILDCFTVDAELTCVSDGRHARGHDELRTFFNGVIDGSLEMKHAITNLLVDAERGRAATEQDYHDRRSNGLVYDERTCNFFEFDESGKITRLRFWREGGSTRPKQTFSDPPSSRGSC